MPFEQLADILRELVDGEVVVQGPLVARHPAPITSATTENLETLIRFQRAAARPQFEPRPATDLTPFLARWHGFGTDLAFLDIADRLRGYAAPVGFWLDDALSPRLAGNGMDALENAAVNDGLAWRGCGKEAATIGFNGDFDLFVPESTDIEESDVAALFKDPNARYTFTQLFDESGRDAEDFNAAFWQAVWAGRIAADGFEALAAGPHPSLSAWRPEQRTTHPLACARSRASQSPHGGHGMAGYMVSRSSPGK